MAEQKIFPTSSNVWNLKNILLPNVNSERHYDVPAVLRKELIAWFHENFHHQGEDNTQNIIKQHFVWSGMAIMIDKVIKRCEKFQWNKITGSKNYGKVHPTHDRRVPPWNAIHVDFGGPRIVPFKLTDTRKTHT